MNIKYLRQLAEEAEQIDPQNEVLEEINRQKRFSELSQNLNDTITYLDQCSQLELFWATEVLEDLSEYFKSQHLIDCVERNITRFKNSELQEQLKMELSYMRMHL